MLLFQHLPGAVQISVEVMRGYAGQADKEPSKILRANILWSVEISMGVAGVRTPITPDESDELNADCALRGVVGDGLATGCRVRRDVWWFSRVNAEISNHLFLSEN
jgi:hypothetical protein